MSEYAFVKPNGLMVTEFVTGLDEIGTIMKMHGATSAMPIETYRKREVERQREAALEGSQMVIFHGRKTPDEDLDDWGFEGPTLDGILWIHFTYMATFNVRFKDLESFNHAKEVTGWPSWDELTLSMTFEGDLLKTKDGYFGDFELQSPGIKK
jgi:hypothetical protein